MPKRIVDSAIYTSLTLLRVPVEHRAEFAWLLALATANGTLEADPRRVWSEAYAYARPDWSLEDVSVMLDAFNEAGMLFRWTEPDAKLWGYFVKIDKPGRLPGGARQARKHERCGPTPPADLLAEYIARTTGAAPTSSTPGPIAPSRPNGAPTAAKAKRFDAAEMEVPDWLPRNPWQEFCQHRKELRKPFTQLAATKFLAELDRLRKNGDDVTELLNRAISAGWQTVFPLKNKPNGRPSIANADYDSVEEQFHGNGATKCQ